MTLHEARRCTPTGLAGLRRSEGGVMRGPAVRTIVIAAGGTGGHLFPAEALAAELLARGERVALMTDARSSAFDSAAFASTERFVLRGSGLSGRGPLRAAGGALGLAAG